MQRTVSMLLVRTVSFVMGLHWVNVYIFPILIFPFIGTQAGDKHDFSDFCGCLVILVSIKPENMCAADLTTLHFLPPEIKFTPIFLSTETFHDLAGPEF